VSLHAFRFCWQGLSMVRSGRVMVFCGLVAGSVQQVMVRSFGRVMVGSVMVGCVRSAVRVLVLACSRRMASCFLCCLVFCFRSFVVLFVDVWRPISGLASSFRWCPSLALFGVPCSRSSVWCPVQSFPCLEVHFILVLFIARLLLRPHACVALFGCS
jgi:hypothetical protein